MIITINGILLEEWNKTFEKPCIKIKKPIKKVNKQKFILNMLMASGVLASGDLSGLETIIKLFQDFAYYIGMGYAIWGTIEYSMDVPAGGSKVKRAIVGFIGVYIIPIVFKAIKNALG